LDVLIYILTEVSGESAYEKTYKDVRASQNT